MLSPSAAEARLVLLTERNEEPSAASPLTYRERTYFSARKLDVDELEGLLLRELAQAREELAPKPRGQLVRLAVFDHRFSAGPERPPIATLQWKDWRPEPELTIDDPTNGHGSRTRLRAVEVPSKPAPARALPPPIGIARASEPAAARPALSAVPPLTPVVAAAKAPAPAAETAAPAPATSLEHDAHTSEARLAAAFEAVQDLYFVASAAEGLELAVKLLEELIPCEAASGCIYDINTNELRCVAALGPGAEARRAAAVPASRGLFGAAVHSHEESIVVADVGTEPRYQLEVDGREGLVARNIALFRLEKEENLLGMLQLINRTGAPGFSEGDIAVATYVAQQVAELLQSKRRVVKRRR